MIKLMRRMAEPVVRLTSVEHVDHGPTFETFAEQLATRVVGDRARGEPRVVALVSRILR
jgi:hypothetical protein